VLIILKLYVRNVRFLVLVKTTILFFRAEDGGSMFLRIVHIYLRVYTAAQSRRTKSSHVRKSINVYYYCLFLVLSYLDQEPENDVSRDFWMNET
jgi:hypothetical protein